MIIANMQMTSWKPWWPRLAIFLVALLLAGSMVFWVLRWPTQDTGPALPAALATDEVPAASATDVTRLLGAQAAAVAAIASPEAANRFRLTGIVGMGAGQGSALLSVDSKPARAFGVGSQVEEGWVVQSLGLRSVVLGDQGKGSLRLQLDPVPGAK
jgi:general secretion pathway protein C